MGRSGMQRVVTSPNVLPLEMSVAFRILGTAVDGRGRPLYEVVGCTTSGQPVRSSAGFLITPAADPSSLAEADIVVVPAAPWHTTLRGPADVPTDLAFALGRTTADTQSRRSVWVLTFSPPLACSTDCERRPIGNGLTTFSAPSRP